MSKFSLFMKENKAERKNGFYAATESIKDENGKPVLWEFKHIDSKQNNALRADCTKEVPITGKPGAYRQKTDTDQYMAKLIAASTVYPDLYDSELQDSYGVSKPEELLYALVDDAGEYQDLMLWVQKFQGFTKSFDETVDEAKN
jgi:hypothetical protein